MANWNKEQLPEAHQLIEKVSFITKTKDSWKAKDGTMRDKWGLVTQESEESPSFVIETFSATDNETIENNTPYDVIVKKTPYGMTLKGFAKAGEEIPMKESTSRFNKQLQVNNKAIALQAVATINTGYKNISPDDVIAMAEVFEAWLKGEYEPAKDIEEKAKDVFKD